MNFQRYRYSIMRRRDDVYLGGLFAFSVSDDDHTDEVCREIVHHIDTVIERALERVPPSCRDAVRAALQAEES